HETIQDIHTTSRTPRTGEKAPKESGRERTVSSQKPAEFWARQERELLPPRATCDSCFRLLIRICVGPRNHRRQLESAPCPHRDAAIWLKQITQPSLLAQIVTCL